MNRDASAPRFTVIVPARNAADMIEQCIVAIRDSATFPIELMVIDDASTDDTAARCRALSVELLVMEERSGPAAARNDAARKARGDILFFVDADVLLHPTALGRAATTLDEHPEIAGIFGSYDDAPPHKGFISQYKNLGHHFIHQESNAESSSFWSGCGAIRKSVFLELGGYDEERFAHPSIEDIELGSRLRKAGHRILLDKGLLCTHLKEWTLGSLLHTDIFRRAIPWTRLMLTDGQLQEDLNLKPGHRLSAILVAFLSLCLLLALFQPWCWLAIPLLVGGLVWLNREFYGFLMRKRGLWFTLRAIPLHCLYYFYSGWVFVLCWMGHRLGVVR